MSIVAIQTPSRIRDILAYQALIVKVAHDYEGTAWLSYDAHFRSVAATVQYQEWSTPDQTIWSQYFSRALPRRVSSNVLAVGPYGQSNAEESERSVPEDTLEEEQTPSLQLICSNLLTLRVAEAQTAHTGTSASHAMDHIASHNDPQKKKEYRSTGCHFGGRVAPVLVANNSNKLSQEHLHTTHASHATSGHASSATARHAPHVSPQTLQDITLPYHMIH